MSAETCRIFGLAEGARGTRNRYLARVHPDDLSQLNVDWEDALKGKALINEHRIRIGDSWRWICQRARRSSSRSTPSVRPCALRRRRRTSPHSSWPRTSCGLPPRRSNQGEGMMITDAEMTILRVNAAFTRVTGYSWEAGQTPRLLKSGRHDRAFL